MIKWRASNIFCFIQVYKVAARSFLPKEWIMEQWDKGFYITAIAGVG